MLVVIYSLFIQAINSNLPSHITSWLNGSHSHYLDASKWCFKTRVSTEFGKTALSFWHFQQTLKPNSFNSADQNQDCKPLCSSLEFVLCCCLLCSFLLNTSLCIYCVLIALNISENDALNDFSRKKLNEWMHERMRGFISPAAVKKTQIRKRIHCCSSLQRVQAHKVWVAASWLAEHM